MTFKEYIETEKEKLGEMNKSEKIAYFKEYYLKVCIAALVILALLVWFLIDMGKNMRPTVVTGGVLNVHITSEGATFLREDYMKSLGKNEKTHNIEFASYILLDQSEPQSYAIFQAELLSGQYNYLITDKAGMEYIAQMECAGDMNEILDQDLKDRLSSDMAYAKSGENGTNIAAAIDISDTAFSKEYITSNDKAYFVVTGKIEDDESAIAVLKYILNKQ
ncbi:MAG: hypothetical protein IKS48_09665 [Eubacterium sp.]|nr:hypothetical protein [Eubacterium sp.]